MHRILSNVLLKDYKIGAGRAGGAGRRDRPAASTTAAASGSCVRECVGIKSNGVVMEKGGGGDDTDVNGEERRARDGDGIECIIHEKERIQL